MLKLIPGRGWVKIKALPDLLLTKVAQTIDDSAFVVGGSHDRNSKQTISEVNVYQVKNGSIHTERKADMLESRSAHGCTVNMHKNEIYVAGGYHMGELTDTCEAYSVQSNTWRRLPSLNEAKCSAALCCLNGRFLYCFGGLAKKDNTPFLLNSIEVLDLEAANPKWLILSLKIPQ